MSIRFQLLLVALTTLVLPWAGCQYARELETALRVSQENALQASADTIANALSAQPQRVFRDVSDPSAFDAAQGDLYAFALHAEPPLNGDAAAWAVTGHRGTSLLQPLPGASGLTARLQAGVSERYLYLYVEVDDPQFDPEPDVLHPDHDRFDRIDLTLEGPDGSLATYFFSTRTPGRLVAKSSVRDADGQDTAVLEPQLPACWVRRPAGYALEARVPLALVGPRLWVEAVDGGTGRRAGFVGADALRGGRLFGTTPGLDRLLATFIRSGTRATVVDIDAFRLGTAGTLLASANAPAAGSSSTSTVASPTEHDILQTAYRRFMNVDTSTLPRRVSDPERLVGKSVDVALTGRPFAEWLQADAPRGLLLSAAAPLLLDDHVRGAVVLEQAGDQLLGLRDRALTHLFNLTLLATALTVVCVLGFATWLSVRIGRLRRAADDAVGPDGSIRLGMPESGRSDEIGDLARAFERLLVRLNEHTRYLRTLGGKLSHELRTPLTIVRSSLDNMESEGVRLDQRGYVNRAREGVVRLQSILSALGAAARVEESIQHAERVNFDMREVLTAALAGYREGFRGARFDLALPPDPCYLHGAPDLLVQLLDKLIENAVDFCAPSGVISVSLRRVAGAYELAVSNDGPPIPPELLERLFESLFEQRQGHKDEPHFGLGLYIVRLIAEFHGGHAAAANRPHGSGAVFTVLLPLI